METPHFIHFAAALLLGVAFLIIGPLLVCAFFAGREAAPQRNAAKREPRTPVDDEELARAKRVDGRAVRGRRSRPGRVLWLPPGGVDPGRN